MIRRIIFIILLKWFIKQSREVVKADPKDEIQLYRLRDQDNTIKLLKTLMTAYTLLYFEAKSEEERAIVKGAALALRSILQGNQMAEKIISEEKDDIDKQVKRWVQFKKIFKLL